MKLMRTPLHLRVLSPLLAAGIVAAAVSASAQQTNATNRLDYSAFKLIADRNIFNPNRYPHNASYRPPRDRTPSKTAEIFSLVGVMSYEKGTFAIFDGTSSDYRQILQLNQSIAGYQVTAIEPDEVKLVSGTNQVELPVGTQMRRAEDGGWMVSTSTGPISSPTTSYASSTTGDASTVTTTSSTDTAAPAGDSAAASAALQKMMQRREQELNR
jgi:hypothetical protein